MSDYLPKDVWIDILTRLPPKNLLRCTGVCKSWYSLITNPSFISTHLNQTISCKNKSNNQLLLVRHYDMFNKIERYALYCDSVATNFAVFMKLECPFNGKNEYCRIVGSCNGLICLSDDYDTYTDTIVLWNPSIRKFATLPKPQFSFNEGGTSLLGFGFDPLRNDYKVVRIVYQSNLPENYNYRLKPDVELYTLSTGTWRSICDVAPPYVVYNMTSLSPAFINGAVHWVASKGDDKSTPENLIAAFDMGAELFREIMVPDCLAYRNVLKLSVMARDTLLAMIEYEKIWQSDYCWVWVMKEYGVAESWTRLFTIDMRGGIRNVVGFRKNNQVLLSARLIGLVSYDPDKKKIKDLKIKGTNRSFYADTYMESLVLFKRVHGVLGRANSCVAVTNEGAPVLRREEDRIEEQ